MGSDVSKLVEGERVNWVVRHSLQRDQHLRRSQIPLLEHFGDRLYMFQKPAQYLGIKYFHFYVTDHTWTIEFGGGDLSNASVLVHNNPKPAGALMVKEQVKTPVVIKRMENVCGARGYSLALRNCEHLARYIFSGHWISLQMLKGSELALFFMKHMMAKQALMVNTLPDELRDDRHEAEPLYPGVKAYIENHRRSDGLALSDEKAFNVLFIGPTGCGKSHLINMLFNATLCKSNASAASVTKMIEIITGEAMVLGEKRKVNVIDTIGFCDTHLTASEVLSIIKDKVEHNFVYIDRVVVMCSGRVERAHADCAKQIMAWLRYSEPDYKRNFTFIYGKADTVAENLRDENLVIMCNELETGHVPMKLVIKKALLPSAVQAETPPTEDMVTRALDSKIHCGFNPKAAFAEVQDEFHRVLDVVFLPSVDSSRFVRGDYSIEAQIRIPVEESWCSIL